MASQKDRRSLGSWLIPASFHQRLQFERFYNHEFVCLEGISRMSKETKVLDAGAGRMAQQHIRGETLSTGADLTTLDLFEGEGVDVVGDCRRYPGGSCHFWS